MSKCTCIGSVRGGCGVRHRTLITALRHCEADERAIASAYPRSGGTVAYSDRSVRYADGSPLHDDDFDALNREMGA